MAADHEKFALLEEMGVEMVLSLEFSAALASMSRKSSSGNCVRPAGWLRLPWARTGILDATVRAMWELCAAWENITGSR